MASCFPNPVHMAGTKRFDLRRLMSNRVRNFGNYFQCLLQFAPEASSFDYVYNLGGLKTRTYSHRRYCYNYLKQSLMLRLHYCYEEYFALSLVVMEDVFSLGRFGSVEF